MALIRNISDTARWAAVYRARESERKEPLFNDPLARRLAGERGEQIAQSLAHSEKNSWSWVTRTYLFDRFIVKQIGQGCDMILNLAAGLDARPYRLALPSQLRWVEVDLPEMIDYKEEVLRDAEPTCRLERVRLDLADVGARQDLFRRLSNQAGRVLVITEGLIIYFTPEEVNDLAKHLSAQPSFRYWVVDIASPPLLKLLQKTIGKPLEQAAAPLKFATAEGPDFVRSFGWKPLEVRSMFHEGGRLKRLPLMLSLLYRIQRTDKFTPKRPWAGVCLLERSEEDHAS